MNEDGTVMVKEPGGSWRRKEWITCKECGTRALVRVGGKGFCSRTCGVQRVNVGRRSAIWKGDEAGYDAMHRRVYRARGKASHCSRCGIADPAVKYEWANLTGNYADIWDFEPMCISCHRAYDTKRGSEHHNAKLTEDIVRELRIRSLAGEPTQRLATEFGVADVTADRAIKRITWKHVA